MQVVINKKDLVTPAQLHEVSMAAARATRKGARLLHCQRGQVARVRARERQGYGYGYGRGQGQGRGCG